MTLAERISDVLQVGGARKPRILLWMAERHGFTKEQFNAAVARLKKRGELRFVHRNGGVHYGPTTRKGKQR